jgi:predicted nucleic acid-binding protein
VIYLDTSALIKRFVNEKGSSRVQSLVQQEEPVATAKIAYAEIFAGLARKLREGHLPRASHALACRQFGAAAAEKLEALNVETSRA